MRQAGTHAPHAPARRRRLDAGPQQLDEPGGGPERVGDRAAAGDRDGGDDLAVELGDDQVAARARCAVEAREAGDRRGVPGGRVAQDDAPGGRGARDGRGR